MADSIREQILTAFGQRLTSILKTNQYHSDIGENVLRSQLPRINSAVVPAVGYHLDTEENTELYKSKEVNELPIRVQGVEHFGSVLPPIMAEKLYADICECVLSDELTLGFDSGGTTEIHAGDTITGETSAATALVISVTKDSGTWAGGDAAGSFLLRRVVGTFDNNEEITADGSPGLSTVDGTGTWQQRIELSTANLVDAITFVAGEVYMPESDGTTVAALVVFNIKYKTIAGNPYSQT